MLQISNALFSQAVAALKNAVDKDEAIPIDGTPFVIFLREKAPESGFDWYFVIEIEGHFFVIGVLLRL